MYRSSEQEGDGPHHLVGSPNRAALLIQRVPSGIRRQYVACILCRSCL